MSSDKLIPSPPPAPPRSGLVRLPARLFRRRAQVRDDALPTVEEALAQASSAATAPTSAATAPSSAATAPSTAATAPPGGNPKTSCGDPKPSSSTAAPPASTDLSSGNPKPSCVDPKPSATTAAPSAALMLSPPRKNPTRAARKEGAVAEGAGFLPQLPSPSLDSKKAAGLGKASKEVIEVSHRREDKASIKASVLQCQDNATETHKKAAGLGKASKEVIEVRHRRDDKASIKTSAVHCQNNTTETHKLPPKLQKVFAKCDKERSRKVEIARAEFDRALEEINTDHSSSLMTALSEALQSPDVVLIYHEDMMLHVPPESFEAQETPERISLILKKLRAEGITDRCTLVKAIPTTSDVLCRVHDEKHVKDVIDLFSDMPVDAKPKLLDGSEDTYCSKGTSHAALLAAGAAIQAAELVISGPFMYSFAIVRPPGHHVGKKGPANGFCFINNISVAADHLLQNHNLKKILILDMDVHHGNGTQDIFYDDKRVLFFSIHRYGRGFFPIGTGMLENKGGDTAAGYNINVCWNRQQIRDADYIAVWNFLLLPLINEFGPEMILISAGYDAAKGDKVGRCDVTPNGFAYLLQLLTSHAIPMAMVLEGGYNLTALPDSVAACVKVLLGAKTSTVDTQEPFASTWKVIRDTREAFKQFWRCYEDDVPQNGHLNEKKT